MKKKQIRCLTATVVLGCLVLLCFGIYAVDAKTIERTEQSLEEIEKATQETELVTDAENALKNLRIL